MVFFRDTSQSVTVNNREGRWVPSSVIIGCNVFSLGSVSYDSLPVRVCHASTATTLNLDTHIVPMSQTRGWWDVWPKLLNSTQEFEPELVSEVSLSVKRKIDPQLPTQKFKPYPTHPKPSKRCTYLSVPSKPLYVIERPTHQILPGPPPHSYVGQSGTVSPKVTIQIVLLP